VALQEFAIQWISYTLHNCRFFYSGFTRNRRIVDDSNANSIDQFGKMVRQQHNGIQSEHIKTTEFKTEEFLQYELQ
jgi:hypothetical protein